MRRISIPFGVKVFAFIWLVVLDVPQLHESFRARTIDLDTVSIDFGTTSHLAKEYPEDPRILAIQFWDNQVVPTQGLSESAQLDRRLAYLDSLITRFPKEKWLRATRISFAMNSAIDMDFEGVPKRSKRILSHDALRKSLVCALGAEKLEPENAFFPMMEAIIRFGMEQNEAGVVAFAKAAACTDFNDYVGEETRQRLEVFSRDHPLLFEEKMIVLMSSFAPYTSHLMGATKTANQMAVAAFKKGDPKESLRICDAVLGATRVFRLHPNSDLGTLIGRSMFHETLEKMGEVTGFKIRRHDSMLPDEQAHYFLNLGRHFRSFAQLQGRSDLAQEELQDESIPGPIRMGWYVDFWNQYGLDAPWSRIAFQGNWFVIQLAYLSFEFGIIWLLGQFLPRVWKRKPSTESEFAPPSRGQMTFSANFSLWLLVGFGVLIGYFGAGFPLSGIQFTEQVPEEMIHQVLEKSTASAAAIAWLFPVLMLAFSRDFVWISPANSKKTSPRPFTKWESRLCWGLWSLALFTTVVSQTNGRELWDGTPFQWFTSLWLAGTAVLTALAFEIYRGNRLHKLGLGQIQRKPRPQFSRFLSRLSLGSAGLLALGFSFVYLFCALGIWPLRATMNRGIERRITMGEIQWIHEEEAHWRAIGLKP